MSELEIVLPKLNKDSVVVEVGANNGDHTILFASRVKKVFAFEPHPKLCGSHVTGVFDNVQWVKKAVSDHSGSSTFYLSNSSDGLHINSSSLHEATEMCHHWWPEITFTAAQVETTTLDAEVQEDVDLIWMDVQGAEMDVLRGAQKLLNSTKMISIEFHEGQYKGAPTKAIVREFLSTYGFVEKPIAGDRSVFLRE